MKKTFMAAAMLFMLTTVGCATRTSTTRTSVKPTLSEKPNLSTEECELLVTTVKGAMEYRMETDDKQAIYALRDESFAHG